MLLRRKAFDIVRVMSSQSPTLNARLNESTKEFYVELVEGAKTRKAILQYDMIKADTMDMYHTGVPVEFRGKGVAKILAKAAMDYAVQKDLKMRLSCSYLQKYAQDNPLPEYIQRIV